MQVIVILGILVGLNVIDCNLCVKEEDLDSQQGVIDFSLYLRSSSRNSQDDETGQTNIENSDNMNAVLDQKNYIEELNRHLKYVSQIFQLNRFEQFCFQIFIFLFSATVGNLQTKVESLTTTNALMKEDLAIARNSLLALQAENLALRQSKQENSNTPSHVNIHDRIDPEMAEALADEKRKRIEYEKELDLQVHFYKIWVCDMVEEYIFDIKYRCH